MTSSSARGMSLLEPQWQYLLESFTYVYLFLEQEIVANNETNGLIFAQQCSIIDGYVVLRNLIQTILIIHCICTIPKLSCPKHVY